MFRIFAKRTDTQQSSPRRSVYSVAALVLFAFATLAFTSAAHAQYRTSIQGVVTDPDGAVVPGARLTLKDAATNATIVRTSDSAGVFNFNALPADVFTLTVDHAGFKTKVLSNLQLIPEQPNSVTVKLTLGAVDTSVTVDASTEPALDTATSNIGTTISTNDIQHMPSSNRDVFTLTQLAPGTISDGSQGAGGGVYNAPGNQGPGGSGNGGNTPTENGPQSNANGGQYETNSINIDGISTVSAVWGGTTIITPDQDAISNVRVITNDYDAENGRFSGAVTQVTSKSGTNQVHGSLFIDIHRPGLNAYSHDLTTASGLYTGQRNNSRYNQYGGSIGGPIWKNKVFAFFDYETSPLKSTNTGTAFYETSYIDALRTSAGVGSIASTYLGFPNSPVLTTGIIPTTCNTIGYSLPNHADDTTRCRTVTGGLDIGSPLIHQAVGTQDLSGTANNNLVGVGNGLDGNPDIAEYATSSPFSSYFHQYNGRLDADVTKADHLSFTIFWTPQGNTSFNGGRGYDIFHHDQINDAFTVIYNHTFSPTFLNEARANAAGWRWNEIASNPQEPVGLPHDNIDQIGNVTIGQFGPNLGSDLNQWTYSYKDVATKVLGQQTIKFGGEYTNLHYLNNPTYNDAPNYSFYNLWDFLNDAPSQESGTFQSTTGLPGVARQDDRENLFGAFFQDDWKVKPNITVNFGIRYSYFGPLYTKQNNVGVASLGTGSAAYTGLTVKQGGNVWNAQKGNFGPQIGFNWSPTYFKNKFVVRGGYGLSYNQEEIAISANGGGNPPSNSYSSFSYSTPQNAGATGPFISYGISSSPTNLNGYAPNPHTISSFNAAGLPTTGGDFITLYPSHLPTQYAHHFSLDTETNLGYNVVLSLGYQGSTSHHLIMQANANAYALSQGFALNPLVTNLDYYGSYGASNNNAFLAGIKHSFAHHFSAEGQFMWAKAMDNGSGPYEEPNYSPSGLNYAYGRSDFNVGKSFKAFGTWQPVIFKGDNRLLEKVAGGWSLSGIFNFHTGFPWTAQYNTPQSLYCQTCGYSGLQPRYLGGAGKSTSNSAFETGSNYPGITSTVLAPTATVNGSTGTTVAYTNKYFAVPNYQSAITWSNPNGNVLSNNVALPPLPGMARNSYNGANYKNFDASASKDFGLPHIPGIGNDAKLEVGVTALNLFNITNLNTQNIINDVTNANFGTINASASNSVLGGRQVTFHGRFTF
jgi:hypothetical protein